MDRVVIKPSTLIHGADLISRYLRCCLVPNGLAFKFESEPPYKPKPLPIGVLLLCLLPLPSLGAVQLLTSALLSTVNTQSDEYRALASSSFVLGLVQILRFYRIIVVVVNVIISLDQHGRISMVIASSNNFLSQEEQLRFARLSLVFFSFNSLANTLAYAVMITFLLDEQYATNKPLLYSTLLIGSAFMFWLRFTNCATLIYTCYMSRCLGQHVKNFSAIYVDSMFDRLMGAARKAEMAQSGQGAARIGWECKLAVPKFESQNLHTRRPTFATTAWNVTVGTASHIKRTTRNLIVRLAVRRYPELPGMEMAALSSTSGIQIGEQARLANNYLIRDRLRRTQMMISDVRDLVNDINKVSSPIIILYILFESLLLVFIITASVQARVFRSVNILIMPTVSVTISVVTSVVCVCIFYDEASRQLKLLMNKLFDFIIMNHRVQSGRTDPHELRPLQASDVASMNETWAQFQYTRKLADTVQLTMGGIFPITRRLVLSVLGHILSAAFISIEIMSIVDTMNSPGVVKPTDQHNATSHYHRYHHNHQRY